MSATTTVKLDPAKVWLGITPTLWWNDDFISIDIGIPFEQCVGRLRCRVRDKGDGSRIDVRIGQELLDARNDAVGDPARRIVSRRNFDASDELARCGVDCDDVGERSPDVNTDPKLFPSVHLWKSAFNA